jgi:SAM-dependent methyltransferase
MGVREACFTFYRTAQKRIVPDLKYSHTIYEDVISHCSANIGIWLDLGCGHELLPPWRLEQERGLVKRPKVLVGLDYDYDSLKRHTTIQNRIRGDISHLPFGGDIFDLVTSNMVFEHLQKPEEQLEEIFRILKPGGVLVFHTPNSISYGPVLARLVPESLKGRLIWLLERRKEDEVFPAYYRINTQKLVTRLAESVGFEVATLRLIMSSPVFIMIPPLVVLELLLIRILMTKLGRHFRTNIIAVLRKPNENVNAGAASFRDSVALAKEKVLAV